MAIVLGLLTAVLFGAGDFCGGLAAKRVPVLSVVAFSHLVGLAGVSLVAPVLAEEFRLDDFVLGMAGGACGGIGVALLYRGLARGPMAVVAPLTAITSAAVPALWGQTTGESLSPTSALGIGAALVAIVLTSLPSRVSDGPSVTARVVAESLAAGTFFGLLFILLDSTADVSAPWPVVGARLLTATTLVAFVLSRRRETLGNLAPNAPLLILTGLFDTGSNVLFLLATTVGDLTIVAVLSSLYPAATVLLARMVLEERPSRPQLVGLAAALVATTLIAVG